MVDRTTIVNSVFLTSLFWLAFFDLELELFVG
jgi:hypothetical protein